MIPNMIEKDILIQAPIETVYRVITEPDQISQWFSDTAEIELVPGGAGTLTFDDRATNQRAVVQLRVEAAEPPNRFAFRWDFPADAQPNPGNSLLVEFALTPEGRGTRLRMTESGFPGLDRPDADRNATVDTHAKGWDIHLASLGHYVTGQS